MHKQHFQLQQRTLFFDFSEQRHTNGFLNCEFRLFSMATCEMLSRPLFFAWNALRHRAANSKVDDKGEEGILNFLPKDGRHCAATATKLPMSICWLGFPVNGMLEKRGQIQLTPFCLLVSKYCGILLQYTCIVQPQRIWKNSAIHGQKPRQYLV